MDRFVMMLSQVFLTPGDVEHFRKKGWQLDERAPATSVPVQLGLMLVP